MDVEQRARAVGAHLREQVNHHRDLSNPLYMSAHGRLLHEAAEVIAALTPPDGYVLVPVEWTSEMRGAFVNKTQGGIRNLDEGYFAALAARPGVKL